MSILVNRDSRVLVQGFTGKEGAFHTSEMVSYGTNIVAGVTPGKGGQKISGIPVFDSVEDAVEKTRADVSVIFVPASFAADAICEAAEAGVRLVVAVTEHIPIQDMMRVKEFLFSRKTLLIGPNCPGIITPDECKVGIMPGYIHKKGGIGVISRSGTLTYEVVSQLSKVGLGQSTCIGIGGDPIKGLDFIDILKMFKDDLQTKAVAIIGEIGGNAEEKAAEYIKKDFKKPVFGFVAGLTAPSGKRMGHAGAIISGNKGKASDKILAMEDAGIEVIRMLGNFGTRIFEVMEK